MPKPSASKSAAVGKSKGLPPIEAVCENQMVGNQTPSAAESANYNPLLVQETPTLFATNEMLFQEDGVRLVQPRK